MSKAKPQPETTYTRLDALRALFAGEILLDVTYIGGPRAGERVVSLMHPVTGQVTASVAWEAADAMRAEGLLTMCDEDEAGNAAYILSGTGRRAALASVGYQSTFDLARAGYRAQHQPAPGKFKAPAPKPQPDPARDYTLSNGHPASTYQRAIIDWIHDGEGDGIVAAVAGAGKTTTLTTVARHLKGEGVFLAFNKAIAEELGRQLAGTTLSAKTIHSVGNGALRRGLKRMQSPDDGKYKKLVEDYVDVYRREFDGVMQETKKRLHKLCDFGRLTLAAMPRAKGERADVREARMEEMAARYALEFEDGDARRALTIIDKGDQVARDEGVVDFTDMLWLTVTMRLPVRRLPWVLVDECQDLNACQLALVRMLRDQGGRMLFVGDPAQAIMGFAGADSRSYETIRDTLGAKEFPLSICYRCPQTHIDLAKTLVPQIEARPGAPAGLVQVTPDDRLTALAQKDDLVISRRNAPLIKHCLRLINSGKAARIKGRDVGKELAELVRTVDKMANYRYPDFLGAVQQWGDKQRATLESKNASDQAFELLADKVETLRELYANSKAQSGAELADSIAALFADESKNAVWLSSVHRSKGLEAERVFVVEHQRLGQRHPKASDDEFKQELNLKYVALTRAKAELYLM